MDMDELFRKILSILPNASFDEDNDGQIIIYTDKRESSDGEVIDYDVQD